MTTFKSWFQDTLFHKRRDTMFDELINKIMDGEEDPYLLQSWLEEAYEAGYTAGYQYAEKHQDF